MTRPPVPDNPAIDEMNLSAGGTLISPMDPLPGPPAKKKHTLDHGLMKISRISRILDTMTPGERRFALGWLSEKWLPQRGEHDHEKRG